MIHLNNYKKRAALFLTSQGITLFGSSLTQFAIIWYVTMQTSSGVWGSAMTVSAFLPQFLVSFFSGALADRFSRNKLIILSDALGVSEDSLRNWEKNGLLSVKRKENGYRVYTDEDVKRLKLIRALRCANYSLEAILRLLRQLSENPDVDVRTTLNTPQPSDDIISVCDRLIASLSAAQKNACKVSDMLRNMKTRFI